MLAMLLSDTHNRVAVGLAQSISRCCDGLKPLRGYGAAATPRSNELTLQSIVIESLLTSGRALGCRARPYLFGNVLVVPELHETALSRMSACSAALSSAY
jgi:hypothetical protein